MIYFFTIFVVHIFNYLTIPSLLSHYFILLYYLFSFCFNLNFRPPWPPPQCKRCVIFFNQKTDFSATRIPTITWIHNALNVTHICTKKFFPNYNSKTQCVHLNLILLAIGKTMHDWTLVRWELISKKILGIAFHWWFWLIKYLNFIVFF